MCLSAQHAKLCGTEQRKCVLCQTSCLCRSYVMPYLAWGTIIFCGNLFVLRHKDEPLVIIRANFSFSESRLGSSYASPSQIDYSGNIANGVRVGAGGCVQSKQLRNWIQITSEFRRSCHVFSLCFHLKTPLPILLIETYSLS